jgi:hypothetical protein
MSTLTELQGPPAEEAHHPAGGTHSVGDPAGACMFCNDEMGLRSTGEDALGFIDHLEASEECRREYQLWKQVITDEWHGD